MSEPSIDDLFVDDAPVVDPAPERPRRPPGKRWRVPTAIAALAAVGAVGYAVGTATADDSSANGGPQGVLSDGALPDGAQVTRGGPGDGFVSGELTAIDGDEWLVTDASGQTVRVKVSESTQYRRTETVTQDDVAIGDDVTVLGETQDDGTVDADSVQSGDSGFGRSIGPGGSDTGPPSNAGSTSSSDE